jgi:hypothetical protein
MARPDAQASARRRRTGRIPGQTNLEEIRDVTVRFGGQPPRQSR